MSDTPRTDAYIGDQDGTYMTEGEIAMCDFARTLEREKDEARNQLARICKEGFDNQDTIGLEPADDYVLRKLAEMRARHAADVAELNQRLIDRHADMMATIVELRQALSGRTVSCSNCNTMAVENTAMHEALNGAYEALSKITQVGREYYDMDMGPNGEDSLAQADVALAKLETFLK